MYGEERKKEGERQEECFIGGMKLRAPNKLTP
jgi:hypothetical protein